MERASCAPCPVVGGEFCEGCHGAYTLAQSNGTCPRHQELQMSSEEGLELARQMGECVLSLQVRGCVVVPEMEKN